MASTSSTNVDSEDCFFLSLKHFPPVINGRINIIEFIDASTGLLEVVDRLGTLFAPVKYDMQGNIDKMKKFFIYDKNSCLLELMLAETAIGKPGAESVLWFNRTLLYIEIVFTQVLSHVQANDIDVDMKKIFMVAYEGSVKKYHNWVTQEIFSFIYKMSPNLLEIIKCFGMEGNIKGFGMKMESLQTTIHIVRCTIDDFFKDHKLFN